MTSISYNGHSLQTDSIITQEIDHHSSPSRDVNAAPLAHGYRTKAIFANEPDKIIKISGQLVADDIEAMDDLEDIIKGYLVGMEKNLDIGHGSGIRRYIATRMTPVKIDRPGGLNWANFSTQFLCSIPFGFDVSPTTILTIANNTDAVDTNPVTIGGSAEYQFPIINLTLNSGTGLTGGTISFENNQTGQRIDITRNWAPGDTLMLDVYEELLEVNGNETYFDGAPPQFMSGSAASFTYLDTFTTRDVSYTVQQYRYWQ